jgi:hypothetical protein
MDAITVSFDEHRNVIEVAGPRWRRCFSIISRSYQGAYSAAIVEANPWTLTAMMHGSIRRSGSTV